MRCHVKYVYCTQQHACIANDKEWDFFAETFTNFTPTHYCPENENEKLKILGCPS
jgi:hypothetical protein